PRGRDRGAAWAGEHRSADAVAGGAGRDAGAARQRFQSPRYRTEGTPARRQGRSKSGAATHTFAIFEEGLVVSAGLGVWMNGERVGHWTVARGGAHTLTYTSEWLRSPKVRSLSLSLPITPSREVQGPAVANYFDNLLPDNERIRERLSRRFGTRDTE